MDLIEKIGRSIDEIYSLDELKNKLAEKRPLRIKYGVDVTAPFLHIGHAVNLWMMRYLQEQGHIVVFLIGDFTTRIGDPTGKSKTRNIIPEEAIKQNAQKFIEQVGSILHTNPEVFEIRKNSEWYDKMPTSEFFSLASMITHAKLIQRDMFQKRINVGNEIFMHEILYPILQGYDSVVLKSDLTIVGSDQLFNELIGRCYQEKFSQSPQIVITTKITPGTDGAEKQSKSLGNYIALADTSRDKFGKIMSIPDSLIVQYLEVYTEVSLEEIGEMKKSLKSGKVNPMELKKYLAEKLVERYHGSNTAKKEKEWFECTFSERNTPNDIPEVIVGSNKNLLDILKICMPESSNSDIKRLVRNGAVSCNQNKIEDLNKEYNFHNGDVVKVGKRKWFRMILE